MPESSSNGVNPSRRFGGVYYCTKRRALFDSNEHEVSLRPKSLDVFRYLAAHHDSVVSRQDILDEVWQNVIVSDDSLAKCVADIRQVLGDSARSILKTVPKRGYCLAADSVIDLPTTNNADADVNTPPESSEKISPSRIVLAALFMVCLFLMAYVVKKRPDAIANKIPAADSISPEVTVNMVSMQAIDNADITSQLQNPFPENVIGVIPEEDRNRKPTVLLRIANASENDAVNPMKLYGALQVAFSRFRTIDLTQRDSADFELSVTILEQSSQKVYLSVALSEATTLIFAEKLESLLADSDTRLDTIAARISAMVASPGTGAVGRNLLSRSRSKPIEELTKSECFAYGYDCTNCSGELDSINLRAEACLHDILTRDKTDARAWSLQSTIYAHQYQWSTNLGEPQRTNVKARRDIPEKALAAANKAEQLSDGRDSAVYWGQAQAYLAACDISKMQTAIERGIAVNPKDPNLLGTFGNWLAYSGRWDEGADMVHQALELEPRHYKRWWLFALAKRHYINGEYDQALSVFEKAFNERNWLSHLQMTYTLPYLNRLDEAAAAAERLQFVFPGITVEIALQLYKLYCFPDEYLARMKVGLIRAGLPERGDSSDFNDIVMPSANVESIGGINVEYMDLGEGLPIVFVHGAMSDYRSWAHYQNPVSDRYRYVSYSRRYHGSQSWQDDGQLYTNRQAVKDLAALIDHLKLGPAVIVSWSSSTPIASILAVEHPELVKALVLYEPNFSSMEDPDDTTFPTIAKRQFLKNFGRMTKLLEKDDVENATKAFLETVFENEAGEFENELMAIRRVVIDNARTVPLRFKKPAEPDITVSCNYLQGVKVPALVLMGETTNDYWKYLASRYSTCVHDATLVTVNGVNHAGPIRKPMVVFDHIDQFVSQLSATPTLMQNK